MIEVFGVFDQPDSFVLTQSQKPLYPVTWGLAQLC